jgi:alanyl-tRNA synthetase
VTSDEIRDLYLSYFETRGAKVIPSSSLVPEGDPTLLLTSAGMVQFKPYFLGEITPPSPRLVSCQKCFRTTDIESVGDSTHLTFFEMLGNFSIGDYFKAEAIDWAWEFVTGKLHLPPERLWVTIFLNDDEAFNLWRKIGVPESRIVRLGETDNFWGPAGSSGPCGPCSEIHYDFGATYGCGQPGCAPGCKCGRFCEIWNLVFTQYNQDAEGKRTPLPRPNIDTGMGLERITAIVQGKRTVYESDLFFPLLNKVSQLSGQAYGANPEIDNAMRVVAEHSRGVTFLIADGVLPSNEGRGYVLRRLIRRAMLYSRSLGLEKPFLAEVAKETIVCMGHIYPEIRQNNDFIMKVIHLEKERFTDTLTIGLELLRAIMTENKAKGNYEIGGVQAFKLYDTYGFPVEMTQEIAMQSRFAVDMDGFAAEMARQREMARAAHKFDLTQKNDLQEKLAQLPPVKFHGYHDLKEDSMITAIARGGNLIDSITEGEEAGLVLAETPFYAEMGGQAGDRGQIIGPNGHFEVIDTIRLNPDMVLHQGRVVRGQLQRQSRVTAIVNSERRLDIARNHTATHLLQATLRDLLGRHVQQRGSMVTADRLRFDFSHLAALTREEIEEIERRVNFLVRHNLAVVCQDMAYQEAVESGAMALFDEKYCDRVRVVSIGSPAVSIELCGGTHIQSTGEIGYFHVVMESSVGAGLRRLEGVTGRAAADLLLQRLAIVDNLSHLLHSSADDVKNKVHQLTADLEQERKQRMALETQLARSAAETLASQAETVKDISLLTAEVPQTSLDNLRIMIDIILDKLPHAIVVLGTVSGDKPLFMAAVSSDLITKGFHAGDIVKKVAQVTGGSGGGKPRLAQAGGKDKDKIGEALALVRTLI